MSTVRRPSSGLSAPLRVEAADVSRAVHSVFEASWLVSRLALGASRPDLKLVGAGPEVVLRWQVRACEIDGGWTLESASAVLGASQRGDGVVIYSVDGEAEHELAVVVDRGAGLISLRLSADGREVLSLSVPATDGAAGPAYARTSVLGAAAPAGLAVGGGRYELDGVRVEMVRG
jgi:hypothetical protein